MQLSEWQKILITSLASFSVGVLAEPIKLWLSENYKKRKLRRLCYERVLIVRDALSTVLKALKEPDKKFGYTRTGKEFALLMVPNLDIAILKNAVEKESSILCQLDIARTVRNIVSSLEEIKSDTSLEEMQRVAQAIIANIDMEVDWNRISGEYLTDIAFGMDWEQHKLFDWRMPRDLDLRKWGYKDESLRHKVFVLRPLFARIVSRIRHIRNYTRVRPRSLNP